MSKNSNRIVRSVAAGVLLLVAGLALTACGSSSSSVAGTTTTGTSTTSGSASFADYTACLKQNGVTLPSFGGQGGGNGAPPSGGNGTPPTGGAGGGFRTMTAAQRAQFQKAQTACASLRPAGSRGFGGRPGGGTGGTNSAAFAAYNNCLKLNGVTLTSGRPDTTSAAFQKAQASCASLRPARPGAAGSNTTTTTTTG